MVYNLVEDEDQRTGKSLRCGSVVFSIYILYISLRWFPRSLRAINADFHEIEAHHKKSAPDGAIDEPG